MLAERVFDLLPETLPKYIGDLPSTADNAVALIEHDGYDNTEYFATYSTLYAPLLRIIVRHSSYATAEHWVQTICKALHRYHDDTLLSVLLVGTPVYLGRGSTKLHEFQITFKFQVKE